MPSSEWDEKINRLTDSQTVQGALLNRLEQMVAYHDAAIAKNEEAIAGNERAIAGTLGAVDKLTRAVEIMHGNMETMQDNMRVMLGARNALFTRMDEFIRGLEGNGHRPQ